MQSLHDDIEDLFKKAAEEYPLKTSSSNWDTVLEQLNNAGNNPSPANGNNNDNHTGFNKLLWLILLIPACLSMKWLSGPSVKQITGNPFAYIAHDNPAAINKDGKLTTINYQPLEFVVHKASRINTLNEIFNNSELNKMNNPLSNSSDIEAKGHENDLLKTAYIINETTSHKTLSYNHARMHAVIDANIEKLTSLYDKKDNAILQNPELSKKSDKHNSPGKFYAGIMGAVDVSTVKTQQMNTGYSIGLLAGYRFSKRIAIETGIYWDKKSYYSDGKYFNAEKLNVPSYTTIKTVDGNCNMWEIPINLRYNFSLKPKTTWFATAGASSYLMHKEEYNYTYLSYNQEYSDSKDYSNSSQNWFSIINVSAGCEKNIGKQTSIRIEPYLKIPVNGVGIGSLPITSTGVNVGIIRRF